MNALADALKKYLQLRRNLGSKLQGVDRPLRDFVAFAKREHSSHITTDLALRWAQQPVHVQPVTWASRLRLVRGFALWLSATDPCTEVPPAGLLPYRYQRQPPYIYSDAQIAAIVRAAGRLVSPKGLRGRTYSTIFGLLSVSGMRVSEALALDRQDVDLEQGILHVRGTKFRKSRLVPLHESTCQVLAAYARARDRVVHRPATAAFFLSENGTRVTGCATQYNFDGDRTYSQLQAFYWMRFLNYWSVRTFGSRSLPSQDDRLTRGVARLGGPRLADGDDQALLPATTCV